MFTDLHFWRYSANKTLTYTNTFVKFHWHRRPFLLSDVITLTMKVHGLHLQNSTTYATMFIYLFLSLSFKSIIIVVIINQASILECTNYEDFFFWFWRETPTSLSCVLLVFFFLIYIYIFYFLFSGLNGSFCRDSMVLQLNCYFLIYQM